MHKSIKDMLKRPGRYAIADPLYPFHGRHVGVEVDENGVCYQLTPDGRRDGVLPADGWRDTAMCMGDLLEFEKPRGSA